MLFQRLPNQNSHPMFQGWTEATGKQQDAQLSFRGQMEAWERQEMQHSDLLVWNAASSSSSWVQYRCIGMEMYLLFIDSADTQLDPREHFL